MAQNRQLFGDNAPNVIVGAFLAADNAGLGGKIYPGVIDEIMTEMVAFEYRLVAASSQDHASLFFGGTIGVDVLIYALFGEMPEALRTAIDNGDGAPNYDVIPEKIGELLRDQGVEEWKGRWVRLQAECEE